MAIFHDNMQIEAASDVHSLREICFKAIDVTLDAGYTLPVTSIEIEGRKELVRTLMLHHVLLRNKAVLDQLKSGLSTLGILDAMCKHPNAFEPYFVAEKQKKLTAGKRLK